ncbi:MULTISPECIES: 5'-3' exonuclease H3TH domain-containing protein [unclassified Variovorax]|uniref:5'-3' exonuclease H3TH domain-containing protein n=1 Tax=unclassified Variovorax TaxID=663243 RepID=UPI0013189702|nr:MULTISPECIES: 5'-3' exonuclease H3TH domain-containing protein [unclassified Variovorax]VTU41969.1 5'-3' exonuclease [Variovorax sp. PBL-H6]VTU44393.1 5'-3' exonuclease [Variovorax sp. SRS16]VTU44434.1 5'-3' exonuclease [Variovorax sp. PBL-E5]
MQVRLIDANALGFAQYFIGKKAGHHDTHAVRGFLEHVRSRLHFSQGVVNLLLWDGRAQWRYDLLPAYKSSRHKTPEQREARETYEPQRPLIQRALNYFPVIQLLHPGAEADDLAFGLAGQLAAQGHLVDLSTSDTDWLSLVANRVRWVNAKKLTQVIELDGFFKATGVSSPQLYAHAKAMAGDTTDDIPGVEDVGLKRAAALLAKYGSLEAALTAAEDLLTFGAEAKYYQGLTDADVRESVRRNVKLVDLSAGPVLQGSDIRTTVGQLDEMELAGLFDELGFADYLTNWSYWGRPLSKELEKADVLSVQRAISNIHFSWTAKR